MIYDLFNAMTCNLYEYQSGCLSVKLFFNGSIKKHNSCNSYKLTPSGSNVCNWMNNMVQNQNLVKNQDKEDGQTNGLNMPPAVLGI